MNKKTKLYILITVLLLAAGISGSIFVYKHETGRRTACIYQNGSLVQTIELDKVTTPYTFDITDENGAFNTIEVRPGEIAIVAASCPDKVCINMGFIKNDMLPITCLPNKLVIKIEDSHLTNDEKLDGLSH